jgi:hypothetical protein
VLFTKVYATTTIFMRLLLQLAGSIFKPMQLFTRKSMSRKGVAVVFLIWAIADLAVPGLCKSDDNEAVLSQTATMVFDRTTKPGDTSVGVRVTRLTFSMLRSRPTSDQNGTPTQDEDCFCCCAHIAPAAVFVLPTIYETASAVTVYNINQVTASELPPYHPPRT